MFLSAVTVLFSARNALIFQKSFQTALKTWVLLQQTPFNKDQSFTLSNIQAKDRGGCCSWKTTLTLNCLQHPLPVDKKSHVRWLLLPGSAALLTAPDTTGTLGMKGSPSQPTCVGVCMHIQLLQHLFLTSPLPPGTSQRQQLIHYSKT